MTTPRRMNLVPVRIEKLDKVKTVMDIDFREPTGSKEYGTPLSDAYDLEAQVELRTFEKRDRQLSGDLQDSAGHLCFRAEYLEDEGVSIVSGDKITKIGTLDVDFEVDQVKPQGHIKGRHRLVFVFFVEPTKAQSVTR